MGSVAVLINMVSTENCLKTSVTDKVQLYQPTAIELGDKSVKIVSCFHGILCSF